MSYRFRVRESVPKGVRRIGREQVNAALNALSQDQNIHQAIHQVRKRIKCLRSLLHLIRPGLEAVIFKTEDRRYRDIGRRLSGARDAQVLLETLTKLETRPNALIARSNFTAFRTWLHDQHRIAELKFDKAMMSTLCDELQEGKRRFSKIPLRQVGFIDIAEGAKSTYKNGRVAFFHAVQTQDGEHFHDWRKNAQRHWRHTQMLRPCWPQMIDMRARFAHELSQLLGDDHDLEVLGAVLEKHNTLFRDRIYLEALLASKTKAQADLRGSLVTHGQLLYAEKPRHFQQRLTTCWNASVVSRI